MPGGAGVLELGPTSVRSKFRVVALVALVTVLVTTAIVLVQITPAQVLTPEQLTYEATASDQPSFPHRTRTQLLRSDNTLSWQV